MRTIEGIIKTIERSGIRCCAECKSSEIDYFDKVYIAGEMFPFPYCKSCGLVQWKVIPGFHLSLEKLYELYLQMADEFHFSKEKVMEDIEYIKKKKGDEGYSDDVTILKEIFERKFYRII